MLSSQQFVCTHSMKNCWNETLFSETSQNFSVPIGSGWSVRTTSLSMPSDFARRLHSVPLMLLSIRISVHLLSMLTTSGYINQRKSCQCYFLDWDFMCVFHEVNNHHPLFGSSWKRLWTPSFKHFF